MRRAPKEGFWLMAALYAALTIVFFVAYKASTI